MTDDLERILRDYPGPSHRPYEYARDPRVHWSRGLITDAELVEAIGFVETYGVIYRHTFGARLRVTTESN